MAVIVMDHTHFFFALSVIFASMSLFAFALAQADDHLGFTVELIHRDSPISPFFNASETNFRRFSNALQRSTDRANRFNLMSISGEIALSSVSSSASDSDYLMKISIGTPPKEFLATVDTGSNLLWIPCTQFHNTNNPAIFDPMASSTYKAASCDSYQCQVLSQTFCRDSCKYQCDATVPCADGDVALETITLGSTSKGYPLSLPNTEFICGIFVNDDFDGHGIVGFGMGVLSLVSQMDKLIYGKFSYCLVPYFSNYSSTMTFGSRGVNSAHGEVFTPIASNEIDTAYYIKLEAISIGGKRLDFDYFFSSSRGGNIVIDSGTTFTHFPEEFYHLLESEVRNAIPLEPYDDPFQELKLCYQTTSDINAPIITMHFAGADVKLSSLNAFVRPRTDIVCLAFLPTGRRNIAVYGNRQQMNFLIAYDLKQQIVSFEQTDCTSS